ncbi:MAG: hypothetical protein AAB075_07770, partial [Gemmatimonadota bacterium]
WKFMLPFSLGYVMTIGGAVWLLEDVMGLTAPTMRGLALLGLNLILGYIVFYLIDRGVIVKGSTRPPTRAEVIG